ncbi:MAG: VTT domain-containing protein [Bacteroidales bacterium]|nr:VTT domain-containing protein [Bacteroidales bacterium]
MSLFRRDKTRFLVINLLRGLAWLGVIVIAFVLIKKLVDKHYLAWIEPLVNSPALMYLLFYASEQIFGLIPPEIFMIWGLRNGNAQEFILTVFFLTVISFFAGMMAYFLGKYLYGTKLYDFLFRRLWKGLDEKLHRYGPLLIIVASLTPLPYSGTCMLVGSVNYPPAKFFLYSLFRILRFAAYAPVIWQANVM